MKVRVNMDVSFIVLYYAAIYVLDVFLAYETCHNLFLLDYCSSKTNRGEHVERNQLQISSNSKTGIRLISSIT